MAQYNVDLEARDLVFGAFSSAPKSKLATGKWSRLVILLHGFPDDRTTWDSTWDDIVASDPQGLVLAPSLRGYEPRTANLKGKYSLRDVAKDIIAIAEKYSHGAPIYLVGHDWGANVTYTAVDLRPDLFKAIVTLAIPYLANYGLAQLLFKFPQQAYLWSYQVTMHIPWLYRPWFTKDKNYLTSLWKYWSPGWEFSSEELDHVWRTLNEPNVIDATTSYYRNVSYYGINWSVDFTKTNALMLAGAKDGCTSVKIYENDRKYFAGTKGSVVILPHVGHFMQREDPKTIAKLITDYLSSV